MIRVARAWRFTSEEYAHYRVLEIVRSNTRLHRFVLMLYATGVSWHAILSELERIANE